MARPLALSLGDPAGIGPEIVVATLAARPGVPVAIYGDESILGRAADAMQVAIPTSATLVPITRALDERVRPGQPNLASAVAQVAYLEAATDAVLDGRCSALVTAPISKEWAARAGFAFPGHTEYLAARSHTDEFAMMLAGASLKIVLVTIHVALRDVPARLSSEKIAAAAVLAARSMARDFSIAKPRIAIAGLNPHAGEAGRFGDEEMRLVAPAVETARARLARENLPAVVSGPHVPDAVFRAAAVDRAYDAVVALYHDQGLIPVKLLDFDRAANVTLGLPFVRTSPDHGTAYDLAGTGRARTTSFAVAFDLAARLTS